jgi:hypothetical protein
MSWDSGEDASRAAARPERRDGMVFRSLVSFPSAHFDCTEMLSVALVAAERLGREAILLVI